MAPTKKGKTQTGKDKARVSAPQHYSTRQIMAMTDSRRRQLMEQYGQQEQDIFSSFDITDVISKDNLPPQTLPTDQVDKKTEEQSNAKPADNIQQRILPTENNLPAQQSSEYLLEREWDKFKDEVMASHSLNDVQESTEVDVSQTSTISDPQTQPRVESSPVIVEPLVSRFEPPEVAVQKESWISKFFKSAFASHQAFVNVMDVMLALGAFALFIMMMVPLLTNAWAGGDFEQGPWMLLAALLLIWFQRGDLQRRQEWFWGSTIITIGGLGLFLLGLYDARMDLQMGGFLATCFGLFLWRYTEESACRLLFPLAFVLFVLPLDQVWLEAFTQPLNNLIFHGGSALLGSFHIHSSAQEGIFRTGGYQFSAFGDPTAVNSFWSLTALAGLFVSTHQTTLSRKCLLFLTALVWIFIGNVVRVALTGFLLANFGSDLAGRFFNEYSALTIFMVASVGLGLTLFFTPREETL